MQVTGRVFITIKGARMASREGAKLKYGGVERKAEEADTGVVGFSEKTGVPGCEFTLVHTGQTSLAELQAMTAETLTFETDTKKSFILIGAWCAGGLELSKSEVQVKFEALDCKEA